MSYDPKCEELARHFLPLNSDLEIIQGLAQVIQDEIEDWLTSMEAYDDYDFEEIY